MFQRTATYAVPAWNRPLDPDEVAKVKANYAEFRAANRQMPSAFGAWLDHPEHATMEVTPEEREARFEERWAARRAAVPRRLHRPPPRHRRQRAGRRVRPRPHPRIVEDPDVAERLCPTQVIGCKRLCVDTGYYETFNRDNVLLVDLNETPIERITPTGIQTTGGEHTFDAIIFATGFDAMTGALLRVDIRGKDGLPLQEAWAAGPRTYLGLGVHGFPNLFTITGPGSPSVLTNMLVSIQQHVEWIAACITHLRDDGLRTIEAELDAQDEWVDFVNTVADITLFPTCNSWYLGANVPGKTRVFMPLPGFGTYMELCDAVVADGYRGFALRCEPPA